MLWWRNKKSNLPPMVPHPCSYDLCCTRINIICYVVYPLTLKLRPWGESDSPPIVDSGCVSLVWALAEWFTVGSLFPSELQISHKEGARLWVSFLRCTPLCRCYGGGTKRNLPPMFPIHALSIFDPSERACDNFCFFPCWMPSHHCSIFNHYYFTLILLLGESIIYHNNDSWAKRLAFSMILL